TRLKEVVIVDDREYEASFEAWKSPVELQWDRLMDRKDHPWVKFIHPSPMVRPFLRAAADGAFGEVINGEGVQTIDAAGREEIRFNLQPPLRHIGLQCLTLNLNCHGRPQVRYLTSETPWCEYCHRHGQLAGVAGCLSLEGTKRELVRLEAKLRDDPGRPWDVGAEVEGWACFEQRFDKVISAELLLEESLGEDPMQEATGTTSAPARPQNDQAGRVERELSSADGPHPELQDPMQGVATQLAAVATPVLAAGLQNPRQGVSGPTPPLSDLPTANSVDWRLTIEHDPMRGVLVEAAEMDQYLGVGRSPRAMDPIDNGREVPQAAETQELVHMASIARLSSDMNEQAQDRVEYTRRRAGQQVAGETAQEKALSAPNEVRVLGTGGPGADGSEAFMKEVDTAGIVTAGSKDGADYEEDSVGRRGLLAWIEDMDRCPVTRSTWTSDVDEQWDALWRARHPPEESW
ncbi:hypothetical protein CBR_g24006, partial [Chara braunii]